MRRRIPASDSEREEIGRLLLDIGVEHDVSILRAKDRGSRARNLHDETSDYDVFFIFSQRHPEYVTRTSYIDVIEEVYNPHETSFDTEVEFHGWNLRKFVGGEDFHGNNGGILGSDPMTMDFITSNLVYYTSPCSSEHWEALETYIAENFKPYDLIGHYQSQAKSNFYDYIKGQGKTEDRSTKRYLNIVQALFKCNYVRYSHELPPMDYNELVRHMADITPDIVPRKVYALSGRLGIRKVDGRGGQTVSDTDRDVLDDWIEQSVEETIDPDGHIDRSPDVDVVARRVENIINSIY